MKRSIITTTLGSQPSLINKKIKFELDCGESILCSKNRYEVIWSQLNAIAFNVAWSRASSYQREINDILFLLSQDPEKLTSLDIDYGDDAVASAMKQASKLLCPNGKMDSKLSEYLTMKRNELIEIPKVSCLFRRKDIISNWMAIELVADNLFNDFVFDHPRPQNQSEIKAKRLEFEIVLSTHPSRIRNPVTDIEIGTAKIELAVGLCTHILDEIRKQPSSDFRQLRNKKILKLWNNHQQKIVPTPKQTFQKVRRIVDKYWTRETDQLQLDALAILLIMDIKMLQSKYLLFSEEAALVSKDLFVDIEAALKSCLQSSAPNMSGITKMETICSNIDRTTEISMPIIARFNRTAGKKSLVKIKKYLRSKRLGRSDLFLIQEYHMGQLICGNFSTLEWLRDTVNIFSRNISIDSWTQLDCDDFKEITLLSPTRLPKKSLFDAYMELIKAEYPNLRTNIWTWLSSVSQWKWHIKADVQSIAYLEQHKRRLEVQKLILKFEIRYFE